MPLFFIPFHIFQMHYNIGTWLSDRSEELAIASLLTILRTVEHNVLAKDAAVPGCAVVPGLAILYQVKTRKETCETGKMAVEAVSDDTGVINSQATQGRLDSSGDFQFGSENKSTPILSPYLHLGLDFVFGPITFGCFGDLEPSPFELLLSNASTGTGCGFMGEGLWGESNFSFFFGGSSVGATSLLSESLPTFVCGSLAAIAALDRASLSF
jgi:hypothetical protein